MEEGEGEAVVGGGSYLGKDGIEVIGEGFVLCMSGRDQCLFVGGIRGTGFGVFTMTHLPVRS